MREKVVTKVIIQLLFKYHLSTIEISVIPTIDQLTNYLYHNFAISLYFILPLAHVHFLLFFW